MKNMCGSGIIVFVCVLVGVWLAGCSSTRQYPESMIGDPFFEEWTPVEAGVTANAEPSEAPATVKAQPGSATEQPEPTPPKIDLNAGAERAMPTQMIEELNLPADTSVQVVLRALAKAGNVNMVISPKVDGAVSFTFKNIPWDQAFAGVLTTAGLFHTWDGEILRVMTLDDMKRELEIEKVMHERESLRDSLNKVEPLMLHVIKVKYMNAKKIAQIVREMVGTPPQAPAQGTPATLRVMVSLDEENNSLIVQATQKNADKIVELMSKLDQPKVQVRIDARIVEANSSTARQLGIQWGGAYMSMNGSKGDSNC